MFLINQRVFVKGLRKIAKASMERPIRVFREGMDEIKEEAQNLAPLDQGDLSAANSIFKRTPSGAEGEIIFEEEYATFMHEGDYSLGPKSVDKNASVNSAFGGVGPKYLERPMDGLADRILREVKRSWL